MVLTLESEANNKAKPTINLLPSPREFGNVGVALDQTSTEFMRRGGWGGLMKMFRCVFLLTTDTFVDSR